VPRALNLAIAGLCAAVVVSPVAAIYAFYEGARGTHLATIAGLGGLAGGVLFAAGCARFGPRIERERRRTDRYLEGVAAARGWRYDSSFFPPSDTCFLRARRRAVGHPGRRLPGRALELTISGLPARLFEPIWSFPETFGAPRDAHDGWFVVLLVSLHLPGVPRFRVRPHEETPLFRDYGSMRDSRVVDLESLRFSELFVLEVGAEADELSVRRLFTPSLLDAMLAFHGSPLYLGVYYEAENGSLLLAGPGTLGYGDGPAIDATVPAAAPVLAQFRAFAESRRGSTMPIHPG
jgi:hypothetical protein